MEFFCPVWAHEQETAQFEDDPRLLGTLRKKNGISQAQLRALHYARKCLDRLFSNTSMNIPAALTFPESGTM